jgi:hypothetical protein
MRDAAGQLADAFHLLRFVQLLENDFSLARALSNCHLQFIVASAERVPRFDKIRNVGSRSVPPH